MWWMEPDLQLPEIHGQKFTLLEGETVIIVSIRSIPHEAVNCANPVNKVLEVE